MKFDLKEMYSYLLSHTFPGLLFLVEILMFLRSTIRADIIHLLLNKDYLVILILFGYAVSTLLGTMLDGVQHCFFDCFIDPIVEAKDGDKYDMCAERKFKVLFSQDKSMEMYKHFVEDDFYYPYEAYANISVAMFFGLILLICVGLRGWVGFWVGLALLFYIILRSLTYEAICTYKMYHDEEKHFISILPTKEDSNPKENS
ncbi:MAG: hypothetical protein KGJ09_04345 [Candidatus Omnitrophica bacterium]|nr:hypothetical protein [Candidatus Omnitrophota bacterium]MDE2009292.1 hypothetical protein [Candidatus Omnitrophota bacterium]MDE2213811.1 hypothetical protein [Candidatus Omnitrophota bacterium]